MPERGKALGKLGFLTIGRFDEADPRPGHEQTLSMIERAEALGFDSVWLRCRHLQPGISSPVAIMAAASQRTSRIDLGTAVIPLGLENPLRLAEDLATVDILSGGRINPGVSVGTPMLYDHYKAKLYPAVKGNDYAKAATAEAANAGFTPLVPDWGNVENTPNPITTLFLTPILENKDPQKAAAAADAKLQARLSLG